MQVKHCEGLLKTFKGFHMYLAGCERLLKAFESKSVQKDNSNAFGTLQAFERF